MNKRKISEQTTIMKSCVSLLDLNGFTSKIQSGYMNMYKTFGTGSYNKLTVTLRDHSYGEQYVSVEFFGLGIKSNRRMEYYPGDIKKLESRIKRLVRNAQASADRDERVKDAKLLKFGEVNMALIARGFTGAHQDEWTGRAALFANGYELSVSDQLTSIVTIAGERIDVDIEVAIAMAVLAPTKFKTEED